MGKLRALIISPLLICSALLTGVQAQVASTEKELAEVKAKGIALLAEIEPAIQEIKSPQHRIQAQLKAAQLLWEVDEKRAARFMSNAIAGIKEFLATEDVSSDEYIAQYMGITQLRYELIRVLAERDPDAALNLLQSTTPRYSPYANSRDLLAQESGLELAIAGNIAQKDPDRALQIARRSLKQGYSHSLSSTVSQLAKKSPEAARELVHEIAGKLLGEEKLIKNSEAVSMAVTLLGSYHKADGSVQIPTREMSSISSGLLSEGEYKQLLQKALGEVLSYTQPRVHAHAPDALWNLIPGLQALGAELDRSISGSKAALDKKIAELSGANRMMVEPYQDLRNVIGSNPVEAVLENIGKAPADYREQLYMQLAGREVANGELTRARQIANDHITNPYQRRQVLANIEQQEMYNALTKGKIEEALRTAATIRNPRDRAAQLSQILTHIGPGQKRATALNLLEQARALLSPSPHAQDGEQMNALFELARAFSDYDPKRSFEIVDPLIDQFNELCVAARTLEGFGGEFFENDELDMRAENGVSIIVTQMSTVLGDLALTNFERTKAVAEKIRLPEARLKVNLEMAQQAIAGDHR